MSSYKSFIPERNGSTEDEVKILSVSLCVNILLFKPNILLVDVSTLKTIEEVTNFKCVIVGGYIIHYIDVLELGTKY